MAREVLDTLLEEYKTVRSESLKSIQTQASILSFGIAGFAALLGLVLQSIDKIPVLVALVLLLVIIPIFSYGILFLWSGELKRMIRAGAFLLTVSHSINDLLSYRALNWEEWLRGTPNLNGRTRQLKLNYIFVCVVFFFFALGTACLGLLVWIGKCDWTNCAEHFEAVAVPGYTFPLLLSIVLLVHFLPIVLIWDLRKQEHNLDLGQG